MERSIALPIFGALPLQIPHLRPLDPFPHFLIVAIRLWSSSETMSLCVCVCVCSLVELLQGGTSGLSVLRTFRLLRILKLVRFMPALRYQLVVMLRTMDNVAMFFILLLLFIFIFRSQLQHLP